MKAGPLRAPRVVPLALLVVVVAAPLPVLAQAGPDDSAEPPSSESAAASPIADAGQAMPPPAAGIVPARWSVAGPLVPSDTRLVLLVGERDCGVSRDRQRVSAVNVFETATDVSIRVDVLVGPAGVRCPSDPLRVDRIEQVHAA